jgi:hypothetical protein
MEGLDPMDLACVLGVLGPHEKTRAAPTGGRASRSPSMAQTAHLKTRASARTPCLPMACHA